MCFGVAGWLVNYVISSLDMPLGYLVDEKL